MNDVGEKIPNWVESARLYYAYWVTRASSTSRRGWSITRSITGSVPHRSRGRTFPTQRPTRGISSSEDSRPPAGSSCTKHKSDHAGDMGLAFYRMYLLTGEMRYLQAAIKIADVLASHARVGTAEHAVWPYRVLMDSGKITAEVRSQLDRLLPASRKPGAGRARQCRCVSGGKRQGQGVPPAIPHEHRLLD